MVSQNILIEPVVTEKTNLLREEKAAKYAFKVLPEANKFQIMEAVEKVFGVLTFQLAKVTTQHLLAGDRQWGVLIIHKLDFPAFLNRC